MTLERAMPPADQYATPPPSGLDGPRLGAIHQPGEGTWFRVWAPRPRQIALMLEEAGQGAAAPALERDPDGYAQVFVPKLGPGARYRYRLTMPDGTRMLRPDPASRYQPDGVHGPSEVTAALALVAFAGPDWREYIFYELHVGTFTAAGTFAGVAGDLDRLQKLGITALELMPVAQFPGARNWGYDGAYPFAAQNSYGGPDGLFALVAAMHARGLAATLDVVYNHLGPEGNYLADFGPYFTTKYATPWGAALNFDGADSGPVRRYFLENALYWLDDIGFDALRLDAIHGIVDTSARPFLAELADTVATLAARRGRRLYLIAESDLNDVRVLRPTAAGGLGMPAQWSDDLHHALHATLTGERQGYYADFGSAAALATALGENFIYAGQYSRYRRRRHGNSARGLDPRRFVVFAQNHDQVGNRAGGDRLGQTLLEATWRRPEQSGRPLAASEACRQATSGSDQAKSGEPPEAALRLVAGVILLAPATPLLFMGEEFGARTPFPYFVSHGDAELAAAVTRGRQAEFAAFQWQGAVPDPRAESTFLSARLQRPESPPTIAGWYRELIQFRRRWLRGERNIQGLSSDPLPPTSVPSIPAGSSEQPPLVVWQPSPDVFVLAHLGAQAADADLPWPQGDWRMELDAATWPVPPRSGGETRVGGRARLTLEPYAFRVYRRSIDWREPPRQAGALKMET